MSELAQLAREIAARQHAADDPYRIQQALRLLDAWERCAELQAATDSRIVMLLRAVCPR